MAVGSQGVRLRRRLLSDFDVKPIDEHVDYPRGRSQVGQSVTHLACRIELPALHHQVPWRPKARPG